MADYTKQATRDADLMLADELAAIATLISQAQQQSRSATQETRTWADSAHRALQTPYARERHLMAAQAGATNTGTSGFRTAGLNELGRQHLDAENQITSTATNRMMTIAEQLDAALNEAANARTTVARKKTLLIGQLSDKYRTEAEAAELAKLNYQLSARAQSWREKMDREALDLEKQKIGTETDLAFRADLGTLSHALEEEVKNGTLTREKAWDIMISRAAQFGINMSGESMMATYGNILPRTFTRPIESDVDATRAKFAQTHYSPPTHGSEIAGGLWNLLQTLGLASPLGQGYSGIRSAFNTPVNQPFRPASDYVDLFSQIWAE